MEDVELEEFRGFFEICVFKVIWEGIVCWREFLKDFIEDSFMKLNLVCVFVEKLF